MTRYAAGTLCLLVSLISTPVFADTEICKSPRLADIGWSDVRMTTAVTAEILRSLGYQPKILLLSTDVTYEAMRAREIDIFLGSWVPGLELASKPYREAGQIEAVRTNLTGAMATLAVPAYTFEAGVRTFADLAQYGDQFGHRIYGIEPGGAKPIEEVIRTNTDGLGSWTLVESSEAGMLAQLERSIRRQQPVVIYGWAPHPMNTRYDIRYLTGGEEIIGPDYGASYVLTDVRGGYLAECPNVARLLKNLGWTVDQENALMGLVQGDAMTADQAAAAWIRSEPDWLAKTLEGVDTSDGRPGLAAIAMVLGRGG